MLSFSLLPTAVAIAVVAVFVDDDDVVVVLPILRFGVELSDKDNVLCTLYGKFELVDRLLFSLAVLLLVVLLMFVLLLLRSTLA